MKLWVWLWIHFWKYLFFMTFHDPIVWNHDFSWHLWESSFFMTPKSFFMTIHTPGHPVLVCTLPVAETRNPISGATMQVLVINSLSGLLNLVLRKKNLALHQLIYQTYNWNLLKIKDDNCSFSTHPLILSLELFLICTLLL